MKVQCPHCKKTILWTKDWPFRPFCSERCKIIDLGAWADGSYSIASSESPEADQNLDPESGTNQEE